MTKLSALQLRQLVARDRAFGDVRVGVPDALDGELLAQDVPRALVVRDDRDVGRVALVARARVAEIVDPDAHSVPSTDTRGFTHSRGTSTDFTPITSRTAFVPPPPPAGPFTCSVRISNPSACAALRSGLRAAMRSRTSYGSGRPSPMPCRLDMPM